MPGMVAQSARGRCMSISRSWTALSAPARQASVSPPWLRNVGADRVVDRGPHRVSAAPARAGALANA